jgi:hypothetical protein
MRHNILNSSVEREGEIQVDVEINIILTLGGVDELNVNVLLIISIVCEEHSDNIIVSATKCNHYTTDSV